MFTNKTLPAFCAALLLTASPLSAKAEPHHNHHHDHHNHVELSHSSHEGHDHSNAVEPHSLMGTHLHDKGEWMVSYRYNYMRMSDLRDGTDDLSDAEVLALANPNAPPANFRVIPEDMDMHMHMFGAMYGVTDWLTLSGMAMYMKKTMDHTTYNMAGTAKLGTFETTAQGLGDLKTTALMRLLDGDKHQVIFGAGLSLPTGDITEEDQVLTPMNTTATLRLPYAMQLGTGTYDFHPTLTYTGHTNSWGWGLQYKGEIRLEDENDEGYSFGDKHSVHAWGGFNFSEGFNLGSRLSFTTQDDIDGSDSNIAAPVPTADPNNYGGERINLGLFGSYSPQSGEFYGHTFGVEADLPLYQDLNGPQMKQDFGLTLRWSYGF